MRETIAGGWAGGVQGSTDATLLDLNTSPRGLNSALTLGQGGRPLAAKRKGISLLNATPITSSPAIIGQADYYRIANSTRYHMLATNIGGLLSRNPADDTLTVRSTSLTSGEHYPDFAIANDLCFVVNGQDRLKFDGTSVTNFGITRPTVGTMAGAAGAAGLHNGTYELRVTFGNSGTSHESSASDTATATVVVVNQAIDWSNIPVSADTQVDRRYLYVRNTATQTQFYRAGTIANNTATTATTSILDANATVAAPTTTSRNRPPAGTRFVAFHQGRMFAATSSAVHWSQIDAPEAFDDLAFDGINPSDGQRIMGMVSSDQILLIFKEDRTYAIVNGNNPATWQVRLIDDDFGCMSHRTIVTSDGTTYWWSRHGLCGWAGEDQIANFTDRYYGDIDGVFSSSEIARSTAARDEIHNRVLISVPATGASRATRILPFNTMLQRFEATYWDPMDAASLGACIDSTGTPRVYLGGYAGQLFLMNSGHNDGVPSGTSKGTVTATATSQSVFSSLLDAGGAAAALVTTGGALIERYFQLFTVAGLPVGRARITANTATTVTVATAISELTVGTSYIWAIGGPDFQFDTPWVGDPSFKKRYEYLITTVKALGYGNRAFIDLNFDWQSAGDPKLRSVMTSQANTLWDASLWDVAIWDSGDAVRNRFRVGRTGFVWRARIRNSYPDQPVGFLSLDVDGPVQTQKR